MRKSNPLEEEEVKDEEDYASLNCKSKYKSIINVLRYNLPVHLFYMAESSKKIIRLT